MGKFEKKNEIYPYDTISSSFGGWTSNLSPSLLNHRGISHIEEIFCHNSGPPQWVSTDRWTFSEQQMEIFEKLKWMVHCLKLTGGSHPFAETDGWHATRATHSYREPVININMVNCLKNGFLGKINLSEFLMLSFHCALILCCQKKIALTSSL